MKKNKRIIALKKIRPFPKKELMLIIALLSLTVIAFTYSWFTSEDSVANSFKGTNLHDEIVEVFNPETNWAPNQAVIKEVRIKNTGNVDSLIRVSLYEFLLMFKVDITDGTGNGNLVTEAVAKDKKVDLHDVTTWQPAVDTGGTFTWEGQHYVANKAYISDSKQISEAYKYNDTVRDTTVYKYIQLNFENVVTAIPASSTKDYWLYEDGYFYYSRPLKPGEDSELLLKNVSLSKTTPNRYKGALYQVQVYMDAHDQTTPVFSNWKVSNSSQAYTLLNQFIE
ncbi:BsaA family SipW-dependent biofilm matrix protein [Enterococcus sp. LJL99]